MTDKFVSPTNEIVAAIFSSTASNDDLGKFASDPRHAITEMTNLALADEINITVEQNQGNDVHLILPYYSAIEQIQAEILKDSSIQDISGGEVIVSLCIFGGCFLGAVLGSGTAAMVAGGAIGACIAGGIVGAAVIGGTTAGIKQRRKDGK